MTATRIIDDIRWTSDGLGHWSATVDGVEVEIGPSMWRATRLGWMVVRGPRGSYPSLVPLMRRTVEAVRKGTR